MNQDQNQSISKEPGDIMDEEIKINHSDLRCPITMLYFREPVVAFDGHLYEEDAIREWFLNNTVSPMTNKPIDFYGQGPTYIPCHFVKKLVDEVEINSKNPFFYMERGAQGIRDWIRNYVKKYDIKLTEIQTIMINDIPRNTEHLTTNIHSECKEDELCTRYSEDCSFRTLFGSMGIKDHLDFSINSCRMPDRNILYNYLMTNKKVMYGCLVTNYVDSEYMKKIIDSTSPDDEGLQFYLSKFICDEKVKTYHPFIKGLYLDTWRTRSHGLKTYNHLLTPCEHYKLLSDGQFRYYIESMDNIDQFNNFMSNCFQYIDPKIHYSVLEAFVSNYKLLIHNDLENFIEKLITITNNEHRCKRSICGILFRHLNELDPETIKNYDLVKIAHTIFHKIVSLGYDFSTIDHDNIYDICKFIMLHCSDDSLKGMYYETLILSLNQSDIADDFMVDLFYSLGNLNIDLQMFFDWLTGKNFAIDGLFHYFDGSTYISLHSAYLRGFCGRRFDFDNHPEIKKYMEQLTKPHHMVIHNLCKFIQMNVPIEISSFDIEIYTDIIHDLNKNKSEKDPDPERDPEIDIINNFYNTQLQRIQELKNNEDIYKKNRCYQYGRKITGSLKNIGNAVLQGIQNTDFTMPMMW